MRQLPPFLITQHNEGRDVQIRQLLFALKVTINQNDRPPFYRTSKYESEQRTMQFNGINTLLDLNVVGFIALSTQGCFARYSSKLAPFTHRFH